MNEFTFDLQRFAAAKVTGNGNEEIEIPAGKTVSQTIRVNGKNQSLKLTNKSAAALHVELENGLPNSARWLGMPGSGSYFEISGGANSYTRYQSLDDKGSLMKMIIKSPISKYNFETYATGQPDYETKNGFMGWGYRELKDCTQEEKEKFSSYESRLTVTPTKITDLDFNQKGITSALYSLAITPKDDGHGGDANDNTKVTVNNVREDNRDHGLRSIVVYKQGVPYFYATREAYLKVTANTTPAGSALQVQNMYADNKGRFFPSPEAWTGTLTLSGLKDKDAAGYQEKYASLKYAKPKKTNWHLHVTDISLGSAFTGLTAGDYVETAPTGNTAVTLTAGSYNIYHTAKNADGTNAIEHRSFTIVGQADIKTDSTGHVSSLSNLSGKNAKVTLTEGNLSTIYQLKGDSIWKTETVNGKKISHKTAATTGTNLITLSENNWTFAGGTEALDSEESLQVGTDTIAAKNGDITVTANGDTYTIGGINEGEEFRTKNYTYHRYHSYLYVHKTTTEVRRYVIGQAPAGRITGAQADIDGKLWKQAVETSDANAIENIDLTKADALLKRLKKQGQAPETLSFIHDKYLIPGKQKAILATTIQAGNDYDENYQHFAGGALMQGDLLAYAAMDANAGQRIKVADGWTVATGKYDDTITGAAKGSDTINAGAGKNTIKLGGAADTVIIGTEGSQDTITGYASGKDMIEILADGFHYLVKGADLYLTNAEETLASVDGSQHALLKGAAVSTKAVNINGENYYFGGVKVNVDKKTKEVTATKAQSNTFNYNASDASAHYIGSTTTTADEYNDLAVNSPKAKKPGLDTLKVAGTAGTAQKTINLTNTSKYVSIDAVNASGMKAKIEAKKVVAEANQGVNVTASATGLRFTGSKFADTVTCGNGRDYIITGMNQGADKVNGFGVNDVIQINGLNAKTIANLKKAGAIDENGFLKQDTPTLGTGSLTVNHAAGVQLQVSGSTIKAVSTLK